jgi:hypothetical protein
VRGRAALALTVVLAVPASAQEPGGRPELALPPVDELMRKLVTDTAREYEFTRYHLHRHGAAAVPALRAVLNGESVKRRWRAAQVLEAIGPGAKDALPDLVKAMKWEPEPGREGGPGELDGLRSAAYRLCGRLGHRQALGIAKSQVAIEIKRIAKLTGKEADAGKAAGWLPAAIGCWLELGGKGARKALSKQVTATAKWRSVSPQGLLTAVGASRHPDLILVLAAVCDAADVEIRAVKLRNDKRIARAERLEKPPEGLETPGPAKPMALAALRAAASPDGEDAMRNGGAWAAWHESNAKWLYYSVTDRELRVDTAAREAGVPTAKYRADHPWADRQGPYPPLEEPTFAGGIPRLRPGEKPMDLPGEGHKDG